MSPMQGETVNVMVQLDVDSSYIIFYINSNI